MKRFAIPVLLLAVLARSAAAQAPGQTDPTTAPFLEKRVPEELATEGVVLSRRNLGLQIEQLADKWLVSLVDLTTGRVAASTKLDRLPPDREAAVAAMTHVVAELAAQIVGRGEPAPLPPPVPPPATPAPAPGLIDDRAERAQREVVELSFRRRQLHFGATFTIAATNNAVVLNRRWNIYRGDLDQEVEPLEFYREVGRPDLADAYTSRRHVTIALFAAGGVALATSTFLFVKAIWFHGGDCDFNSPDGEFGTCLDARSDQILNWSIAGAATGLGSAVLFWIAAYRHNNPHPISENAAKSLADEYNQRLRRQLGLPVVASRPLLRDLTLTPYLTGGDAGLAFGARF